MQNSKGDYMTQSSIIRHIYDAKNAHKRWMTRTEHLISGLPVDKSFIPSQAMECDFGKWLYFEGAKLRSLPDVTKIINSLEHHHNELHMSYMHIYKIYFVLPKKRSILHKILTLNSRSVSKEEIEKAKEYFEYLQHTSIEIVSLLDILEKRIKKISLSDINKIA
jgi:hypothetical protein